MAGKKTSRGLPFVKIYTDGGCDPNPGPGGWGAVLLFEGRTQELQGAEPKTTNNRMELRAAIEALRALDRPYQVELFTDSQYLRRGITEWLPRWQSRGWRKANGQPVMNRELWEALAAELERHCVQWHWVRGHKGDPFNERADRLATQARQRLRESGPSVAQGTYALYPRGCALGSPGPAGCAVALVQGDQLVQMVSRGFPSATNNAMELRAVLLGLSRLPKHARVVVYTTSKYVFNGATRWLPTWESRGWRTRDGAPVKNKELWQKLAQALRERDVDWRVLSARARHPYSEKAASAAQSAAERMRNQSRRWRK
ncbi:MAG: ribonuclease HI [Anaerolineae bacterium]|nr:ribonuclease HI [Anaerolineae bacterium]